jgi:hypothetical protein
MLRKIVPSLLSAAGIAILSTGLTIGKPSSESHIQLQIAALGRYVANEPCVIERGRILMPVGDRRGMLDSAHALFDALGVQAIYDPYFHHLTLGLNGVQLEFLGDGIDAMLDGAPYPLEVPASEIDGVYYIPARSFAHALGIALVWQRADRDLAFGGTPRGETVTTALAPAPVPSPVSVPTPALQIDMQAIPTVHPATPPPPAPVRFLSAAAQMQPHASISGSAHGVAEVASGNLGAIVGADYATSGTRADAFAGVGAPRAGHIYATVGGAQANAVSGTITGIAYGVSKLPDLDLPTSAYGSVQYVPLTHAFSYQGGFMFAPQSSRLLVDVGISGMHIDDDNPKNVIYTGSIAEYLGVGVRF